LKRHRIIGFSALLLIIVFSIIYIQLLSGVPGEEPSATGFLIGFSSESATTLMGLLIVFLLVWFTWKERE
jgi:hypothetical protein